MFGTWNIMEDKSSSAYKVFTSQESPKYGLSA